MAEIIGKKLSDATIPVKTTLTGSEQVYINDAGTGKKTTTDDISDYALSSVPALIDLKQTVFTGICQICYLTENDIVIDNTALTLTIATIKNGETISASNPITFFTDGAGVAIKHTISAPVVFTFTNTTGIWYFYFNSSGTAIATQVPWSDFATIATVWRFYWNSTLATADKRVIDSVEYHKNDISWVDHMWKHSEGTRWISGFDISSNKIVSGIPAVDGSNAVISLSTGTCQDDNLNYTVTNAAAGVVKFTQNLGGALLPATSGQFICISNDSSGRLIKLPATAFPFLWNSGTNTPEYLIADGTRTPVTNNYYFVYYVYALQEPRVGEAVKIKSAEIEFANATLAAAHSWEQLQAIFPTLRDNEIRLLYKLTFEYKSTYDVGTKKTALRVVDDLRKQKITTTAVASGTLPATSITFTPNSILSSTNVQSALDEVLTDFVDKTTAQSIYGEKEFIGTSAINGSAPVKVRIKDLQSSSLWTVGAEAASFELYSSDPSGSGAGVKAKLSAIIDDATGSYVSLGLYVNNQIATILGLKIKYNGALILPIAPTAETATANPPLTRDISTGEIKTGGKQIVSIASDTTPNPTGWAFENEYYLTALAGAITEVAAPSGTPVNGNTLLMRIKDDGTARAIAWNAIYKGFSQALPTTTILGKEMYLGFIYNSASTKWDLISRVDEV